MRGFLVRAYDPDEVKVAQLAERENKALKISSDARDLSNLDAYVIASPTPSRRGAIDLGRLEEMCVLVGKRLTEGALIVIESRVEIGVSENVCLPALERASGLSRHQLHLAYCPARERSPDGKWRVENTPRVIGALNDASLERAVALYGAIIDAEIRPMRTIREAEAVNTLEHAFLDINAALVNELAMSARDAQIDLMRVIEGAATKPFSFLPHFPGFTRSRGSPDPYRFVRRGTSGYEHRFLAAAHKVNQAMPAYAVRMLADALREKRKSLKGATVALLGLDEGSDGPSREIIDALRKKQARVHTFDPLQKVKSTAHSLEEAIAGAVAVIIALPRQEFLALDPRILARLGIIALIDGTNRLKREAILESGIIYRGIGR